MTKSVIWGFLTRWALEVGGFGSLIIGAYISAPPAHQEAIQAIFAGNGGGLTVNAVVGLALYTWGRIWAYRATVAPQVVTTDGAKITLDKHSASARQADAVAAAAKPARSLFDRLFKL